MNRFSQSSERDQTRGVVHELNLAPDVLKKKTKSFMAVMAKTLIIIQLNCYLTPSQPEARL
ncbi:hypothetical protein DPX16_20371 [Anabarilius grahami]|uniref:Uncharacterized protein n=1 Tax=Anabarilius grahami TaxID=495550 RepID=A0A3N0XI65_ANAGA|nr:hypothetical protein DPX16_20371 [Anabarilius grahami]